MFFQRKLIILLEWFQYPQGYLTEILSECVSAVFRTVDLVAGPLPLMVNNVATGLALAWVLVMAGLALRVARRRGGEAPAPPAS